MTYIHNLFLTIAWAAIFIGAVTLVLVPVMLSDGVRVKRPWLLVLGSALAIMLAAPYLVTELHH